MKRHIFLHSIKIVKTAHFGKWAHVICGAKKKNKKIGRKLYNLHLTSN